MTPEYRDAAYRDTALLFSRAGFGALHSEINRYKSMSWPDKVDLVLDLSRAPGLAAAPDLSDSRGWYERWVEMAHYWLNRSRRPVDRAPIQEKMTLFWHGLLCSGLQKVGDHQAMFDQNMLFRRNALGNFEDLLWQTSIGPAMLKYLDNRYNRVDRINENFARELMELFTLGVGNYTEADVRSASRAWTGHGLDDDGAVAHYRFNSSEHDHGSKTFLGRTGNWDGRDIVRIIVDQGDTHSRFLCRKLWSFFAYPVGLWDSEVSDVMSAYQPNLDIGATVRAIFMHPAFRSERAHQGLLRSPFEFAVAVMRHSGFDAGHSHPEWYLSTMGQTLFDPPNVSGWKQNDYWVNESAIWGKGAFASYVRWRAWDRGDLEDVNEVIGWSPRTYKVTIDQAFNQTMANYDMRLRSERSVTALKNYVATERASDNSWGQRGGLLMLPFLTPDFQLA